MLKCIVLSEQNSWFLGFLKTEIYEADNDKGSIFLQAYAELFPWRQLTDRHTAEVEQ